MLSLNSELAREYDGKLILRLEDTNPENIYEPAYHMIPEDANWLTKNNISEVSIQSDRMGAYYDHAEKLVDMGKVYICTCNPDTFKALLAKCAPCPCRSLSQKDQHLRYDKMFGEYKPGDAVMRLKTNLEDKNPAMRDFALIRINEGDHPKAHHTYRVWPLMNFAVAIDDHLLSVTHTLRGKDHMDNEKRQKMIADCFGWSVPVGLYVGRINFTDMHLSTTDTKKAILEGKYTGWDDIRLPFIPALKRRGYQPDAFIGYAMDVGISPADKQVNKIEFFKSINHFNKLVLDPQANRYFFVQDPIELKIEGAPQRDVKIELHPDFHARGCREFKTEDMFFIAKKDMDQLEDNKIHRLMDCANFTKKGKKFTFHSQDHGTFKDSKNKGTIMHWLPKQSDLLDITVFLEDGLKAQGKGEPGIAKLHEGAIVQLERFGFCRLDKKTKSSVEFWFTHR